MEMEQTNIETQAKLTLSTDIKTYLFTSSKWATFLAIMGFISTGVIAIAGLIMTFFGSFLTNFANTSSSPLALIFPNMGLFYIALAVLCFFPAMYLFRFAGKAKEALANNMQEELVESFRNLKKWFKFNGVMTIVLIAVEILIFPLIMIITVLSRGM